MQRNAPVLIIMHFCLDSNHLAIENHHQILQLLAQLLKSMISKNLYLGKENNKDSELHVPWFHNLLCLSSAFSNNVFFV